MSKLPAGSQIDAARFKSRPGKIMTSLLQTHQLSQFGRSTAAQQRSEIACLTSITGGKDALIENQAKGNARFIAFLDDAYDSKTWEIKPAYDRFTDPRRNSRMHKLMSHKYSDADIIVWIDGNMRLVITPEELVAKYLGEYDMAVFRHGARTCLYDEALECCKLKLDNVETIIEQVKYYEDNEYAKNKGLPQSGIMIRRNNQRTRDFNEAWWADYCRFSRRDQLSIMPAITKAGLRVNFIPEAWVQSPSSAVIGDAVEIVPHKHTEGNWNHSRK